MSLKHYAAAATAIWVLTGTAQAALFDRGGGMIYDDVLNITWLQNWNQAVGSAYDTHQPGSGLMNWLTAKAWAENLSHGGFSDWRLPTIVDSGATGCNQSSAGGTDCGYNVQTKIGDTVYSEMAHMYYVTLGNLAYCPPGDVTCAGGPQPGWGLVNTGPFTNMQYNIYWSGAQYVAGPDAWVFAMSDGSQTYGPQSGRTYAVAVHPGDVAAVPEPQAFALMLMGVVALLLAVRQRDRG